MRAGLFENTSGLADANHRQIQRAKRLLFGHGLRQRFSGVDRFDQMTEHPPHPRLALLLADQFQTIQQRQARPDGRTQLSGHRQNILAGDPLAAEHRQAQVRGRFLFTRPFLLPSAFDQLRHEMTAVRQRRNRTATIDRVDRSGHMRSPSVHAFIGELPHKLLQPYRASEAPATPGTSELSTSLVFLVDRLGDPEDLVRRRDPSRGLANAVVHHADVVGRCFSVDLLGRRPRGDQFAQLSGHAE